MAEREHAQTTPSRSSQSREKGLGRRVSRRKTCFRGREIVQIGVLRATQNQSRKQRAIRRRKAKKFKEFESLKMSPNMLARDFIHLFEIKWAELADYKEISDWRALTYLTDALRES
ncbi:hypothetical protein R3W88_012070 [Solanum pinnatisectum]|uniref:Uncharacterized protein n=1 Tax=Solanum pinnatisectum TaxID=50273 RepID=A0AAV9L7W0_9SOLN|nr:hypothetical protein R3W88_012070 [Solanum pinnatisectum]